MTTPISDQGIIRIPTWLIAIIVTIVGGAVTWAAWISGIMISTRTDLVELRAQVRSTAVPEGTEKALNELRARMNAELQGREAVSRLATENAKDIGYLNAQLSELKHEIQTLKERKP